MRKLTCPSQNGSAVKWAAPCISAELVRDSREVLDYARFRQFLSFPKTKDAKSEKLACWLELSLAFWPRTALQAQTIIEDFLDEWGVTCQATCEDESHGCCKIWSFFLCFMSLCLRRSWT